MKTPVLRALTCWCFIVLVHLLPSSDAQTQSPVQGCTRVQTDTSYTQEFIDNLPNIPGGFVLAVTTGSGFACQKLMFFSNKTYIYSYGHPNGQQVEFTGRYDAGVATLSHPGYLVLDRLQAGELGAGLDGVARLMVLMASDEGFVMLSCAYHSLFASERLLGFITSEQSITNGATAAANLETVLKTNDAPIASNLFQTEQACPIVPRGDLLYNTFLSYFLIKLGLIRPPVTPPVIPPPDSAEAGVPGTRLRSPLINSGSEVFSSFTPQAQTFAAAPGIAGSITHGQTQNAHAGYFYHPGFGVHQSNPSAFKSSAPILQPARHVLQPVVAGNFRVQAPDSRYQNLLYTKLYSKK